MVYAKPPFAGPEAVLAYLSRYTHRVAISNSRLLRFDADGVTFRYKNYREAGTARFRAILLTSLTTFAGLSPLLLEESVQAQFLIPMGISLAFGVIFATLISLVLVPVSCLILEDLLRAAGWLLRGSELGDGEAVEVKPSVAYRESGSYSGVP